MSAVFGDAEWRTCTERGNTWWGSAESRHLSSLWFRSLSGDTAKTEESETTSTNSCSKAGYRLMWPLTPAWPHLAHLKLEDSSFLLHLLGDLSSAELGANHPVLLGMFPLLFLDLCAAEVKGQVSTMKRFAKLSISKKTFFFPDYKPDPPGGVRSSSVWSPLGRSASKQGSSLKHVLHLKKSFNEFIEVQFPLWSEDIMKLFQRKHGTRPTS